MWCGVEDGVAGGQRLFSLEGIEVKYDCQFLMSL